MLTMFGEAFGELETYNGARPSRAYLERLIPRDTFIAVAALDGETLVGGIAAYVLDKFEQERSEVYIYDLAVAEAHRRRGIATAMIREVQRLAAERGVWVIFVQADRGDDPAIALYTRVGEREDPPLRYSRWVIGGLPLRPDMRRSGHRIDGFLAADSKMKFLARLGLVRLFGHSGGRERRLCHLRYRPDQIVAVCSPRYPEFLEEHV